MPDTEKRQNKSGRVHSGKKKNRRNKGAQASGKVRDKNNERKKQSPVQSKPQKQNRPAKQHKPLFCESCGKAIANAASAMRDPGNSGFLHFDCVIRMLEEQEELLPQQKIMYIGHGEFAVTEINRNKHNEFTIVRKIPYETAEMKKTAKIEIQQYIDIVNV